MSESATTSHRESIVDRWVTCWMTDPGVVATLKRYFAEVYDVGYGHGYGIWRIGRPEIQVVGTKDEYGEDVYEVRARLRARDIRPVERIVVLATDAVRDYDLDNPYPISEDSLRAILRLHIVAAYTAGMGSGRTVFKVEPQEGHTVLDGMTELPVEKKVITSPQGFSGFPLREPQEGDK